MAKNEETEFYVCPHHIGTGGWESCCSCGGWEEGSEERLCTEAIEHEKLCESKKVIRTVEKKEVKSSSGLFKHQEEGIAFLRKTKRAILADEMGLGKTRQAIIAARESGYGVKVVVCPASLKINWEREIKMIYANANVYSVQSGPEIPLPDTEWLVINYDMLPKYKDQIIKRAERGEIETLIVDEAHYIKGKKTIRAVVTVEIALIVNNVYLLTGTPIMNRPIEMYNLLKAIKHPLGRVRSVFSKRYCGGYLKTIIKKNGQIIRFFDESGATHIDELREFIRSNFLRRLKKDVLDLPEKIVSVQIVELDKASQKEYDNAFDSYVEWVQNNPGLMKDVESHQKHIQGIMDARHLVELMKLKQVCSRAKIERIANDIRSAVEQDQKVIVFSQFTGTINALKEELMQSKRGTRYDDAKEPILSVTLTGDNNMQERQDAVDMFQKGPAKVFIANIKAGGVGITLTAASIVKFADMEWSPEIHSQAEDRAHRIGQNGTVNVYYYIAGDTIEEDIVDILERKRAVIKRLMDGDQGERWAQDMERIERIEDEEKRSQEREKLMKEMSESSDGENLSMAAEFLGRMKARLGIHN